MTSLIGTPILVLFIVLTIGLPVLALACWSRMRGPRVVRAVQRSAILVASQIAAVMVVALLLNDYGNFYDSWQDLFAGSPGPARITAAQARTSGNGQQPTTRLRPRLDPAFASRAQWPTRGRLESVTLTGANSELTAHALIYLPPQYFRARYVRSRFPVIEVLSGLGGARSTPSARPVGYPRIMLSLIHAHRARPTVLALIRPPAGRSVHPRGAAACTDLPAGAQGQIFYTVDVPRQLSASYRLRPIGWGVLGAGTGGYCATKFAMTMPQTFTAAVSRDGYYTVPRDLANARLWGGSTVLRNENDLTWRLRHLPAPPTSVLVVSGREHTDPSGYRAARAFTASARPPMTLTRVSYPGLPLSTSTGVPAELSWLASLLATTVRS